MVNIAIVDDDLMICEKLSEWIAEYDIKYESNLHCDIYTSCNDFFNSIQTYPDYHLIFLDIEFPGMSGIELGSKIRRYFKNITQIIFISVRQDYAMELFDIQPFNFLVKPLKKDKFFSCLTKFMMYYAESNCFFEYTYENLKHRIAVNEIIYFKSYGKKLLMHTTKKDIYIYGKITDIKDELKHRFIITKRGIAVNIHHITNINFTMLELTDGSSIGISRNYREEVRDRLSNL
jgi:DNA-binding LytR/AlgR family response regulator